MNTYHPPERGIIAPNSATEMAPSNAYTPPRIQTPMNKVGVGSCLATSPGVRRIPMPIVPPIVTANPKPTPRTRSSPPLLFDGFWSKDGWSLRMFGELTRVSLAELSELGFQLSQPFVSLAYAVPSIDQTGENKVQPSRELHLEVALSFH